MTVEDRLAPGYEPRWDIDARYGHQGELFVQDIQRAFEGGSVEIKRDARWEQTGNLFVEFECLRGGQWHGSGIATTGADIWAFVLADSDAMLAVSTTVLKRIATEARDAGRVATLERGSHPTRGVLLSAPRLFARLQNESALARQTKDI